MRLLAAALLLVAAAAPCRADVDDGTTYQLVIVKPGDTMWAIANKLLKDPARWDEILKHNRLPTQDPTVALPGMTLRVPIRLIKVQLRAAHLVYSVNQVLHRRKETPDWKPSKMAMELFQGDTVRTLDDSKARVKLLDKELFSLEPNSMAVIKPQERDGDLELKAGSVFAGHARVVTASARVTPRTSDTRYAASIEADLTTRVEVYRGSAGVDAQGNTIEVPAGMSTRVQPGLAPEKPRKIANFGLIEKRAREYESAVSIGGGAVPESRAPKETQAAPSAPAVDSLSKDLQSLLVGVPISGYLVQAASDREFKHKVFDHRYEAEQRIRPGDVDLRPGVYWWRMATVDLLGTEGRFSEPRSYAVGGASARAASTSSVDLKKAVTIVSPAEGAVLGGVTVQLVGTVNSDQVHVEFGGKTLRPDGDGNFAVTVPLASGVNEIALTVFDGDGNSARILRRVTRR